ncbi:MAG: M23 family metallopeptidase [Clostridiales bacterium]|nr:M23 family metallopeptidase [Candidatus Apopatousia equi]
MNENENVVEPKNNKNFFKKYAYYLVLGAIALTMALVLGITAAITSTAGNVEETTDVNTDPIEFICPVANGTILKGYSATELQYNKTLNEWSIHKAIDYGVSSGANVMACYDGTVESVSTNVVDGTCIIINHGNNLKTSYKSLDNEVKVSVGDTVKTGDVIALASNTASGETTDASQVHFEVWKDGTQVDPAGYLDINGK